MEEEADIEAQSSHETLIQTEGVGFIAPNTPPSPSPLVYMSENEVSMDELQRYKVKPKGGGGMLPQNGTTIDITVIL